MLKIIMVILSVCAILGAQANASEKTKVAQAKGNPAKPAGNIGKTKTPMVDATLENKPFPGEFEFKGLSIGQLRDGVFSSAEKKRIILQHPSKLEIVGFLPQTYPHVQSTDFAFFACSKKLGEPLEKAYEQELSRKRRETMRALNVSPTSRNLREAELEIRYAASEATKAVDMDEFWVRAKDAAKASYAECPDTIANRRITSNTLGFYKDQLGLIEIIFEDKDFNTVLEGLTEKYGQPFKIDKSQLNIKLTGAPSSYVSALWKDSKGNVLTIQNHEQDGSVFREKGILTIGSPDFAERLAKERKNAGVIPAVKDL